MCLENESTTLQKRWTIPTDVESVKESKEKASFFTGQMKYDKTRLGVGFYKPKNSKIKACNRLALFFYGWSRCLYSEPLLTCLLI